MLTLPPFWPFATEAEHLEHAAAEQEGYKILRVAHQRFMDALAERQRERKEK